MISFLPTKHAQPKQVELQRVLNPESSALPEITACRSLLTAPTLHRVDVYVQNIKQVYLVRQRTFQAYQLLCAITPDVQVARACAGFVDLIQCPAPYAADLAFFRQANTVFEYVLHYNACLVDLNAIRQQSRGKGVLISAPELNYLGLRCLLEQLGFNVANLQATQLEILKNASARMHRAVDGVGFE